MRRELNEGPDLDLLEQKWEGTRQSDTGLTPSGS